MSKHGGSPVSGLIEPVGVDRAAPDDGGVVLVPPQVLEARKEASERQGRALQFERRRLALEAIDVSMMRAPPRDFSESEHAEWEECEAHRVKYITDLALKIADALIAKTGGVV